ncbi:MAG: DUF1549 domain-containing protein [Planctomycetes bacterium]|nr:DUF1549 domain-containing protein [Planctomycetota bacterium]
MRTRRELARWAAVGVVMALAAGAWAGEPVSFQRDVMAVLSKAGCNMGACHGGKEGKGGFQLSLRGQDPGLDFVALTKSTKRVVPADPDASLILRKPTLKVTHEGGKRFDADSMAFRILRAWIADGAHDDAAGLAKLTDLKVTPAESVLAEPNWSVEVKAIAVFSDGSTRDVSDLAVYEPADLLSEVDARGRITTERAGESTVVVRYLNQQRAVRLAFVPRRPGFVWADPPASNDIDKAVFAKLKTLRMDPSALCDDATFVRRAYLDILGLPPTADEARRFVADTAADKRARVIDALLNRPEFADFWALKWSDLLRNEEKVLDKTGVSKFHDWVRQAIDEGMPLDVFARQILSTVGSSYKNPPANFYRALRHPTNRSETIAQIFLGTRLQCAQCHNHPYEPLTQSTYYSFAAAFDGIGYDIVENKRTDKNDKNQFIGEQIVQLDGKREVVDPRTKANPEPTMLDGTTKLVFADESNRLEPAARWITDPSTAGGQRFAEVQANRIWYHMMGRGVVEPVDDFRITNPPVNPALLDVLRRRFVASGYDLRDMIRFIANSRVYQLSSEPNETNAGDDRNFASAIVRRLPAEVIADAVSRTLDVPVAYSEDESDLRAVQLPGVAAVFGRHELTNGARFLRLFGKPPRLLSSECERSDETALGQVLELTSGPMIHEALTRTDNVLGRWVDSKLSDGEIVDELLWRALNRGPSERELVAMVKYLHDSPDRRAALEDMAWGVLNAKTFLLRH